MAKLSCTLMLALIAIGGTDYLCKDSESHDCAQLNSMFSICNIKKEAKKICPRFCKLCDLIDGKWSLWSPWSSCDVTCGKGIMSRYRLCNNPEPQNGGLDCPGKGTELEKCRLKICPVNGGWNDWTQWGQCSVTCGVGLKSRTRSCTNPTPSNAGQHCLGRNYDVRMCYQKLCPGKWADWQPWSRCSGSCGRKVQTRKRTCSNKQINMECEGNALETQTCPLVNVALGKPSQQINIHKPSRWGPKNGNDGNDGDSNLNSCFHTLLSTNPWWEVDLVDVYCISRVDITNIISNIISNCCAGRATNVEISVAKEQGRWSVVAYRQGPMGHFFSASFNPIEVRYVRVTLRNTRNYLHLCEVKVFGCS